MLTFLILSFISIHCEFSCGEHSLVMEIPYHYSEKVEVLKDGRILSLNFEGKGLVSISCLQNNSLPMIDTVEFHISEKIVKNGKTILKGDHLAGYVWREDILSKNFGIRYIIRKEFQKEFDDIFESVKFQ